MHVNDHKIQDMGVRKFIYFYHFMSLINITWIVPFQFLSFKNQY